MSLVSFVNGLVLVLLSAIAAGIALVFPATRGLFSETAIILGPAGTFVAIASSSRLEDLSKRHAFILTGSVWITAAAAGSLPLYLHGLSPIDAFFEAMSGITTTGSTVMSGLDTTPQGLLFWRAALQALGGVGFIVTGIALLPILKVGGMQLFHTESSDKGGKELRNAGQFAAATLVVYAGLMTLCAILYSLGGMSSFDAITHAMTTLSTGGYSGYDASFGHFDSAFLQWTCTLFMLCGALPFAWYIRGLWRRHFRSEQVEAMLKTLVGVIFGLAVWLVITSDYGLEEALRLVSFNVISVVTTTGYATTDYTTWGAFAAVAFFLLTAVGGCTGSTSGGAKAMRWVITYRAVLQVSKALRFPHGIHPVRYEGATVDEEVISGVVGFFTIYAMTFTVLAMALGFIGLDLATATSGALTALANVGPGIGDTIGPAGNFASLPDSAKIVLVIGMYMGRLEMLTVLVLLMPSFWRSV
jgi:trk system potassium uptake protein TrkH